jgi:ATP-dependent helicase/nuclease subunit A
MSTRPAYRLDGRDVDAAAFYGVACDPRRHVVVEACAGAGKTWMLVARIVRALLDGAQPQEILAITFTRKAAGEMRTRLADWLREFAALTHEAAAARLVEFGLAHGVASQRAEALVGLQARVLRSGRTVEVRTFHAWYAQLLRAAPLELLASLGLAPGLALLEDSSEHRPAAMHALHHHLLGHAALRADFERLSTRHGRTRLDDWLWKAIERRIEIERADEAGTLEGAVPAPADREPLRRIGDAGFVARLHRLARLLGARSGKRSVDAARALVDALRLDDRQACYEALRVALFTEQGNGTPRRQLGDLPEQATLCAELDEVAELLAHEAAHDDHVSMVRLSRQLFVEYAALKRRRGLIDMNDLERLSVALLSDHALAGWVQERLDARVRHLLIDEFQDTSPLQWHALHGWLSAYAGAGGGAEGPRLFIVGDPKQSIYRFRRAEPRVFEAAQRFVVDALGGTLAACDHTRRCAPGVVDVVNHVFGELAAEGRLPGWRPHSTQRTDRAPDAALLCLPSAQRPASAAREDGTAAADAARWRPSLTEPRYEAKAALRDVEAAAVARAVATLVHQRGLAPAEIFVLARRGEALVRAARALAALHLPCVAPEGLQLGDLPEAQDLLAVLDVLASPGQALSLARALRSPLFEVSDADLQALALQARAAGGWWPALMQQAEDAAAPPSLKRAARLFAAWRSAADTLPPHDLLDRIVHEGDLLPRLAAVVPPERHAQAMDAVRALLACALDLDGGRYASPYGFVRALRQRRIEAPLPVQEDAVRLHTIHGAKGLEARAVLLMDTEPQLPQSETAALLVDWPVESPFPRRVAFVASETRCPPPLRELLADEQAARAREELNTLYVALTRAKDTLLISRTPPISVPPGLTWWARLQPLAAPWPAGAAAVAAAPTHASHVAWPLSWRSSQLPEPSQSSVGIDRSDAASERLARLGRAVHRWLEWAARDPAADRQTLAHSAARAFGADGAAEVLQVGSAILDSPQCRPFFDTRTVAWAGNEVPVPGASGDVRRIDRLVRLAGTEPAWWVLDYKLAGTPQQDPALRAQLAEYRTAVAALAPGEVVRAAFITGRGELIEPDV